jgi:hypothetical protein
MEQEYFRGGNARARRQADQVRRYAHGKQDCRIKEILKTSEKSVLSLKPPDAEVEVFTAR